MPIQPQAGSSASGGGDVSHPQLFVGLQLHFDSHAHPGDDSPFDGSGCTAISGCSVRSGCKSGSVEITGSEDGCPTPYGAAAALRLTLNVFQFSYNWKNK